MLWSIMMLAFASPVKVQEGDIVFQRSTSAQSVSIAAATGSNWTHVGIIRMNDGQPYVLEAVQPVRRTQLTAWVARGQNQVVAVRRPVQSVWTTEAVVRLDELEKQWLGRDYDARFEPGMERVYCSELVREAYLQAAGVELAPLRTIASYQLESPALQRAMKDRFGAIPVEQLVVAPSDLFDSDALMGVP